MNNGRTIIAIAVAAMLALVAVPIVTDESEAASGSVYGQFNVWIYEKVSEDQGAWSDVMVADGYDAVQALNNLASNDEIDITYKTIDGLYAGDYIISPYGYYDINSNYGTLDTVNGSEEFTVYCLIGESWEVAWDQIGFYRPFSDYDPEFSTANIAIVIGDSMPDSMPNTTRSLVTPTETEDFKVTFHFTISDNSREDYKGTPQISIGSLIDGITLVGYGSDVYAAFKDAISSMSTAGVTYSGYDGVTYVDEDGNTQISTMYGYIEDIFGLEYAVVENEGSEYDTYYYWSTYIGEDMEYCNFMFGYYSPLSEVPQSSELCGKEFTLVYTH